MNNTVSMDSFMEQALEQARQADLVKEVPVGCVFVYRGEIIAKGYNRVNETRNATRHVEFICIDQVLEYIRARELPREEVFRETTVVVTVEPCIMCAAALINLNVKEIIYGCKNDRFGGCTVLNVPSLLETATTIRGGVRAQEAMDLLKLFYKGENPSAPAPKAKTKK